MVTARFDSVSGHKGLYGPAIYDKSIVNSPVGYGGRALVRRCAMTPLHLPLATVVVEVTTQGVNKKCFGVGLVVRATKALWGSIPHPPVEKEGCLFPSFL